MNHGRCYTALLLITEAGLDIINCNTFLTTLKTEDQVELIYMALSVLPIYIFYNNKSIYVQCVSMSIHTLSIQLCLTMNYVNDRSCPALL